jgi:hypothetical protein
MDAVSGEQFPTTHGQIVARSNGTSKRAKIKNCAVSIQDVLHATKHNQNHHVSGVITRSSRPVGATALCDHQPRLSRNSGSA